MKIGIFTDAYTPQINGVVTSVCTLKEELEKLGHEIFIITSMVPNYEDKEKNIIRINSVPFMPLPELRIANPIHIKIIRKLLKMKFDVIHTQTEFSIGALGKFISKLSGCPLVHTYHTLYENYTHYLPGKSFLKAKKNFARNYSRFYCNWADIVIAPTKKVSRILLSYNMYKPIKVIPSGIKLNQFYKNYSNEELYNARHELNIEDDDKIMLFVGRISKEKNIQFILETLPEIVKYNTKLKFLIVGDGGYTDELKNIIKNEIIEKNVIFAGAKAHEEVSIYYKMADVFVSASNSETQGLTYVEAMAAGLPVLAKADPCLDWLLKNKKNSCIFESKEEFIMLVNTLLNDKSYCEKIKQEAVLSAKLASSEVFAHKIENVYNEALNMRKYNKAM